MGGRGRGHRGRRSGASSASGPQRTCCGCGETDARKELVRLTLGPDGHLMVDLRGRGTGRGAWVHCRRSCVDAVVGRPGALSRSLHQRPDTSKLKEQLREAVLSAAMDGLSMAAAAGLLVGGRDQLTKAFRMGRIVHVVLASDASERTVSEYRHAADEGVGFTVLPQDVSALGARVGKGPRAALGIRPSTAAAHLMRQLRRLRDLG